ncbi:Uu.00g032050.m01.CDS01 [Anthostomella pinea]|uniref:Uu.00g032050.m01.CDS01 n=1 Tax=Anthostomella pinea TaxID=933095 RepID=A0AAI8V976_9PEZI|nr:Uu.00g032050.m01.CDS01 [Anthostomella pinea]
MEQVTADLYNVFLVTEIGTTAVSAVTLAIVRAARILVTATEATAKMQHQRPTYHNLPQKLS